MTAPAISEATFAIEDRWRLDEQLLAPYRIDLEIPRLTAASIDQGDTIRGLTDEQLADYEQRAEAAMLTALESVMNTIAAHLGATRTAGALVAHLPGKHDQRTHGRKGAGPGGGVDLIAAGQADALAASALEAAGAFEVDEEQLAGRRLYRGGGVGPHGDEALHHIATQQGFDGPAQLVTKKEMDRGVRRGDVEMFRGVRKSHDGKMTAAQVHESAVSGDAYYGLGYSGNGIYLSNSRSIAGQYGQVGRYALHRDARVVDFRDLQREQGAFLDSVGHTTTTGRVFSDPGRYAAARGYDAIRWRRGEEGGRRKGEEDEFIVLNRSALLAEPLS